MSPEGLSILRLAVAAINGVLFALGVVLLLEMFYRRPNRMRRELRHLIAHAEKLDLAQDKEANGVRLRIDELKKRLHSHYNNPWSLLTIGFSVLMIVIALMALLGLIVPPFEPLVG